LLDLFGSEKVFTLAFFNTEPTDTESKGIGMRSQPDWSALMMYIS